MASSELGETVCESDDSDHLDALVLSSVLAGGVTVVVMIDVV